MKNLLSKILVSLLLLISTIHAYEVDSVFIHLDSLKQNIEIDSPWQFHSGDDTAWASPNYNSASWDTLRSWFKGDETKWEGIGWFRKTIVIDYALRNKAIAFQMYHYGASEIYLNGNLVHKFGTVGKDTSSEKIFQPLGIPIVLELDTNLVYTLAIRYSNQRSIIDKSWMKHWLSGNGFEVSFREINLAFSKLIYSGRIGSGVNFGIFGLFLSLSILYFFLFIFYVRRVENLYYSFFTFFIGLIFASVYMQYSFFGGITYIVIIKIVNIFAILLTFIFYLAFLNSIFYKRITKIFYAFLLFAVGNGILIFIHGSDEIANISIPAFIILTTLEGLRIIIIAIKNKAKNAWIIGGGVISFVSLIVVFLGIVFITGHLNINGIGPLLLFVFGLFGLSLSMSIYLAKDIAFTNKRLEQQLITVKELSTKELEHQKRTAELELKAERQKAENDRKTKELEDARNLQLSLLPKSIPEFPEYEIAVYMKTATEVGGDYYDFNLKNEILTIVIGDATGHGLNAGTMVTATKSLFNNFAEFPDIISSMQKMSVSLKKMNFKFLSMCFALLKIEKNKLRITSAGMPPAYIYRSENKKIEELMLKGMPLGTVRNYPYQLIETELNNGDVLFLYSDGFPELFNPQKELLGYEKMKNEFIEVASKTPNEIIERFKLVIDEWREGAEINDDITFIVVKKH